MGGQEPTAGNPVPESLPVATVGALVENSRGEILLVRTYKWGDRYSLPGGKIERGETQEAALRRELREETGLEVHNIRFLLVQDCIDSPEFHRPAHMLLLNYHCRADGMEVRLNDEAQSYGWVTPRDALRLDLNEPTRRLIEHFLNVRNLQVFLF
jgi:ADP-ribose pyrophosphatase YjhB (NUDIX family)